MTVMDPTERRRRAIEAGAETQRQMDRIALSRPEIRDALIRDHVSGLHQQRREGACPVCEGWDAR
jgi:hypothetical protein